MTQVGIMWNVRDPLGLYLNQKYLKLGLKRLSYGKFTNWRLRDSSEYHAGCMGSFGDSFELKISKNGLEIAMLRQIYQWEVA